MFADVLSVEMIHEKRSFANKSEQYFSFSYQPSATLDRSFISSMSKKTFKVYFDFEPNTISIALVSFDGITNSTSGTKLQNICSFILIIIENVLHSVLFCGMQEKLLLSLSNNEHLACHTV